MAPKENFLDPTCFNCPVCLDLLKDPVAIPCGHSYCMNCIKGCWDQDDHTGVYSCPQCRQTFIPRPVLGRNTILAEVVEKLKKAGLPPAPPANCYAGAGDVECDACRGRKRKALKSCLVCVSSYCESHLELHNELNPGGKHKLINVSGQVKDKICSHHDKHLQVCCHAGYTGRCVSCRFEMEETTRLMEEQNLLRMRDGKLQKRFNEKQTELEMLAYGVDSLKRCADEAVQDSEMILTELVHFMERRCSEVKELIRDQEKAAVSQAEGDLERLEQEIAELRRRDAELEQLSHGEDAITFLQTREPSLIATQKCFGNVTKHISHLKDLLEEACREHFAKVSQTVRKVNILHAGVYKSVRAAPQTEPRTRAEFLQYACELTLDPNTAHNNLLLSDGNRVVTFDGNLKPYPDHPQRFDWWDQVLCGEGLTGRCYWEAEWTGSTGVDVGVTYQGISRKDFKSLLGYCDKSWSLDCTPSGYSIRHNNKSLKLPVPRSSRIGVYVDHSAGTLSFYSISDTMTLLHRVHTTFTQPLYAGFRVYGEGTAINLCTLTPPTLQHINTSTAY